MAPAQAVANASLRSRPRPRASTSRCCARWRRAASRQILMAMLRATSTARASRPSSTSAPRTRDPMDNSNLFAHLRDAFPRDAGQIAVETEDGLAYSWSDVERATAMLANLLGSLG